MTVQTRGFTIVELLIVIVVISILASVTVTAFGNVQARAKAVRAASTGNAYIKLLKMYYAEKGTFPFSVSDSYPTFGDACLGLPSDFPARGGSGAGDCVTNPGDGYKVGGSTSIVNALMPYGRVPSGLVDDTFDGEIWRGIRYSYSASSQAANASPIVEWHMDGGDFRNLCPAGSFASVFNNFTYCDVRNLRG